MDLKNLKNKLPILVAIFIAIIVVIFYIMSGKGSQDLNTRLLQSNSKVENVETKSTNKGDQTTVVKCKNGSSYGVYYPPGSTNFTANGNVKCEP